jgi:hypothetical protein
MPDVDDFMELQIVELMRRASKFVVQRDGEEWKLTAQWKTGQLDDAAPAEPQQK